MVKRITPSEARIEEEVSNPRGVVQVYGQGGWHEEAFLVGDRKGLLALRDALNRALEADDGLSVAAVSVSDGEGYNVFVMRKEASEMEAIHLPYPEHTGGSDRQHPWECLAWGDYDRLMGRPPRG